MNKKIYELAEKLGEVLIQQQLMCVVAESCTGGCIAAAITDIPGSSRWFERGYVTYSNEAKQLLLAVPEKLITTYGAVSQETACAMAEHAILQPHKEISVAVTGIAGPSGGSIEKPIGTVWIAWAGNSKSTYAEKHLFHGNRDDVRYQATATALNGLLKRCR